MATLLLSGAVSSTRANAIPQYGDPLASRPAHRARMGAAAARPLQQISSEKNLLPVPCQTQSMLIYRLAYLPPAGGRARRLFVARRAPRRPTAAAAASQALSRASPQSAPKRARC